MKPRFSNLSLLLPVAALLLAALLTPGAYAGYLDVEPAEKRSALSGEQQRRFNTFYLEAIVQRENGNADVAYELLRHALEINPDAPEALYEMARLQLDYNADDTTNAAEALLRRAVELEPGNYYFQKELADYYSSRDMTDSATARYEAMAERFKDRDIIIYSLLDIYKQKNNYEALIRTLRKLEVREGKSEELSMGIIDAYIDAGLYDSALVEVNSLIALYPGDTRYPVLRGNIYMDKKQPQRALDEFSAVLAKDPQDEAANYAMMAYYQEIGNDSAFVATAQKVAVNDKYSTKPRATALNQLVLYSLDGKADTALVVSAFKDIYTQPDADATLLDMYQAYLIMLKEPLDSIAPVWERVLVLKPDYTQLRLKLLQYYISKSDFAKAAALCEDGARQEPTIVAYYFYGGMAYFSLKDNEHAADMLKRGTAQISRDTDTSLASDLYGFLGDVYHEMGKAELSYQAYDTALVYKDDNIATLNNYAYYLSLERRDLDKAAAMSLKTVKAEPNNAIYLDTYAWVLFEQGKTAEALTYIRQALKNISPTGENASIYEHAGDILSVEGNTKEALEMWKKAQELNSDSKTLKKKIKSKKYIAQ